MDSENEIMDEGTEVLEDWEAVAAVAEEKPTPPPIEEPVLFENVHVRNEQTYKELYRLIMFGGVLNIIAVSAILLGTLAVCAGIGVGIAAGKTPALWYWCLAAFGIIYVPLFKIYPYRYYVKFAVARDAEMLEGEEPRLTVSVTERAIIIDAPRGERVEVKYSTIKSAHATKHYLLLKTHAKVIYTVSKDGFTKGSYEELCAFLRAKGIKI